MHELSLAQGILDAVLAEARKHRAVKVAAVDIRLGVLSHVVADSLTLAFSLMAEDTPAAGAELRIERIPAQVRCRACKHEEAAKGEPGECAVCHSRDLAVDGGRELQVVALEIEEDD